jgi:hypothetical protein
MQLVQLPCDRLVRATLASAPITTSSVFSAPVTEKGGADLDEDGLERAQMSHDPLRPSNPLIVLPV